MTRYPEPHGSGPLPRCLIAVTRNDGASRLLRLDRLRPRHRAELLALQDAAHGPLMHPLTVAEIDAMLGDGGVVLGGFLGDRLAAFLAIQFPGASPGHLGRDYGLPEAELDSALHLTGVLVHPDLRGNGLFRRLVETAAGLPPVARHRYWFATVRPENLPSVRGMLSAGLHVFGRKPKHDGHDRFLFVRDLREDARPGPSTHAAG